jgi:hypothetical protein
LLGPILAAALTLGPTAAARASAGLVLEPFQGGPLTGDTTPTFSGSSEDHLDPVKVNVYEGATAAGSPVRTPSGVFPSSLSGSWSATVANPLGDGTYTAVAEQPELGGVGQTRVSAPYTFTVDTQSPIVKLDQPESPSNDSTPSFSGTASDTTPITVVVHRGASAQGAPVASLKVSGTGGPWISASVSPPLADGEYTAVATQPSSLENLEGMSNPVTFVVDTASPSVTLRAPPARSNDTTPSFSGTASEASTVTVEVFEGTRAEGAIVATVQVPGTRGGWTAGPLAPALPRGVHTYTAVAAQPSEIKNPPGRSAPVTFEVNTEPPAVTLQAPPSPSGDTTPSFSGTASERTPVTVKIFKGAAAEGPVVASATATGTGAGWSSTGASPSLTDGTYTAVAIQPSEIENPTGQSAPVTFAIDTAAPSVTLNSVPSPSPNGAPSFSGTASDHTPVSVSIYRGARAEGAVASSLSAEASNGRWVSGRVDPPLVWGEYTAVASQASSIGNPAGVSTPVSFTVAPIPPRVITEAASSVTARSATLYGSVNPLGASASQCNFEWGTSSSYGESVGCGFVEEAMTVFPPEATAPVSVLARIYGLRPATTYHFRVTAVTEGGTSAGEEKTFTTLPPYVFDESSAVASARAAASANAVSSRVIAARIATQLVRSGRRAKVRSVLTRGGLSATVSAPEAGTAVLGWYFQRPPAARAASAGAPLLVGAARVSFRAAGKKAVKIRLTLAGRRLLRAPHQVRLTATCVFTPAGGLPARGWGTFEPKL